MNRALGAALLSLVAHSAHAQLYTRLPDSVAPRLDSSQFRHADTSFARRFVDATKCGLPRWPAAYNSIASLEAGLAPYRSALATALGVVPITFAGARLDGHVIYSDSLFELDYVLYSSRVLGVSTMAYVLRPQTAAKPNRTVILLHGAGTLPEQSFGLRLIDEGNRVYRADSSTFIGLGIGLAARGYTVISPLLFDEPPTFSSLPWSVMGSLGLLYFKKMGSGGSLTLLESQVLATVDYAIGNGLGTPRAIAVAGWQEGAMLASLAAAIDPRIGAVIRLGPPIDQSALAMKPFSQIDAAASFMQVGCSIDERVQSALASPRRFFWVWTNDDSIAKANQNYVDPTIVNEVRREQTLFGLNQGAVQSLNASSPKMTPSDAMANWLDNQVFGGHSIHLSTPNITAPPGESFPSDVARDQPNEFSTYIGNLGQCPQIDTLFARTNTEAPGGPTAAVRAAIRKAAGIQDAIPNAIRSVSRKDISSDQGYRLTQITITLADLPVPIVGLLATPLAPSGVHPAVLAFNGDDGVLEGFGFESPGTGPYLNGYADYYAKRGYVVFIPYLPIWFTDAGTSIVTTRNPAASTWSAMVPFYEASVSFLRSLPTVDPTKIAAYGISFAGVAALITTAVDDRITALVYSDIPLDQHAFFSTGPGGLVPPWWIETCGYIEASFQAIAPRRFVWEAGEDSAFANGGYDVIRRMQAHYAAAGAPRQFEFIRHGGGHETRPGGFQLFRPE